MTIGVVAAQSGRDGWGEFESYVVSLPLCHVYSRFSDASKKGASCARMVQSGSTSAFQADGTGSNPASRFALFKGMYRNFIPTINTLRTLRSDDESSRLRANEKGDIKPAVMAQLVERMLRKH